MHFLKTLFWVVLAVAIVLFSSANWTTVTLNLWGGLEADVKLPVLIFAAFLIGFVPTFAYFRTRMWTLHRRLGNYDRQAAQVQTAAPPPAPAEPPAAATSAPYAATTTDDERGHAL